MDGEALSDAVPRKREAELQKEQECEIDMQAVKAGQDRCREKGPRGDKDADSGTQVLKAKKQEVPKRV